MVFLTEPLQFILSLNTFFFLFGKTGNCVAPLHSEIVQQELNSLVNSMSLTRLCYPLPNTVWSPLHLHSDFALALTDMSIAAMQLRQ